MVAHNVGRSLDTRARARLHRFVAEHGERAAATQLGCCAATLGRAAAGFGLLRGTREMIVSRLDNPTVGAAVA